MTAGGRNVTKLYCYHLKLAVYRSYVVKYETFQYIRLISYCDLLLKWFNCAEATCALFLYFRAAICQTLKVPPRFPGLQDIPRNIVGSRERLVIIAGKEEVFSGIFTKMSETISDWRVQGMYEINSVFLSMFSVYVFIAMILYISIERQRQFLLD